MPTQQEQDLANLLSFTKNAANESLIRFLNGLTTNLMSKYPTAEIESWPYQKAEAEIIMAQGDDAALGMAPFLEKVCEFHYGMASDAQRLIQVKEKAALVYANAEAWALVGQFVNGLRARTQDSINSATTATEVNNALTAALTAGETFRVQYQF